MTSDDDTKGMKKAMKKEKKKLFKKRKLDEEEVSLNKPTEAEAEEPSSKKSKQEKKQKKDKKKHKKDKKKHKDKGKESIEGKDIKEVDLSSKHIKAAANTDDVKIVGGRIVSFSAQDINAEKDISQQSSTTLLLFYQYIEPVLDDDAYQAVWHLVQAAGEANSLTGRMRVAQEGLNCTLTGAYDGIRAWCKALREFEDGKYFGETEFKLTDNLPNGQAFPKLHAFKVEEIVNYGLAGAKAPSIHMSGVHLEPKDYHIKMMEDETVIIDVRNHYEAAIGKFQPPTTGATYIDPMMRKSTEFPVWLDKPETKELLRGKQVLMYCTGGVRCERASALLRTKMEKEEDTKALGIKGVFQLQGGIDKYFRDFPEGGMWKGKNYVFDKRFSHAPPVVETLEREVKKLEKDGGEGATCINIPKAMGRCEACQKPWDMYRGKRRCPTCGVPSLICKDCHDADANKTLKLDRSIRCDLCITEGITSKRQIKDKEESEMAKYEQKIREIYGFELEKKKKKPAAQLIQGTLKKKSAPNPNGIKKLFIKNLCAKQVDQDQLCELFPGITHIEWINDRNTGNWYGSIFVEMSTPNDAAMAVGTWHKKKSYGRVLHIAYSTPDPKSIWPPPNSKIS